MKTKEEIFETVKNNFLGHSIGTVDELYEDIDLYAKQEAIAFAKFIHDKDYQPSKWNDKKWVDALFGVIEYTTEELYSLYLQSKEK